MQRCNHHWAPVLGSTASPDGGPGGGSLLGECKIDQHPSTAPKSGRSAKAHLTGHRLALISRASPLQVACMLPKASQRHALRWDRLLPKHEWGWGSCITYARAFDWAAGQFYCVCTPACGANQIVILRLLSTR